MNAKTSFPFFNLVICYALDITRVIKIDLFRERNVRDFLNKIFGANRKVKNVTVITFALIT